MSRLLVAATVAVPLALPAVSLATTADPGQDVVFTALINPATLAATILAVGGAGLVAAFGLGGGFRIAKKVYNWMFSKV